MFVNAWTATCPNCGAEDTEKVAQLYYDGRPLPLFLCHACRYLFYKEKE